MKKYDDFIKLEKKGDGYSYVESSGGSNLGKLHSFFSHELYTDKCFEYWKKLVQGDKNEYRLGNIMYLDKFEGKVRIGSYLDEIDLEEHNFIVTNEEFLEIIDKWQELKKKKYKEIVIFKGKSGRIILEGYDKPTPFWSKEELFVPKFFVIKIETIGHPKEGVDLEYTMTNVLKNRLDKKIGEVWFETIRGTLGLRSEPKCRYIFAIRYDKKKTIQDIANQFPEFTWIEDRGYFVWEKEETDQLFFDKKIEKVEIYTQN